ncbi:MAG: hypothetical protein R3185_09075 [Candidatus Thermoplasmatota archaeon]|nr:hypothetical protein [Candidatus Thermoplasmatota archaeon]
MSPGLSAALVVLLITGAAAGTASMDASYDLEEELKLLLDNTMRDLDVGWLDAVTAHGNRTSTGFDHVQVLVRADGTSQRLALEDVLVLGPNGSTLEARWEAVRDPDGSLDAGVINADDLARLVVLLPEPVDDQRLELTLHHPRKAPLNLHLGLPGYGQGLVQVDILRDW